MLRFADERRLPLPDPITASVPGGIHDAVVSLSPPGPPQSPEGAPSSSPRKIRLRVGLTSFGWRREGTNLIGHSCLFMELATFITSGKTSPLFREARLAMLTHRALHHIDVAGAAAEKAEQAVAELIEAMRQTPSSISPCGTE